jgi:uncharacterized protein YcfJ
MKKTFAMAIFLSVSMNAYSADPGAVIGGAVGGGVGAAVGHEMGGKQGAIIGGAIGGATGAAVGSSDTKTVVVKTAQEKEHSQKHEGCGDPKHDKGLHLGQCKDKHKKHKKHKHDH